MAVVGLEIHWLEVWSGHRSRSREVFGDDGPVFLSDQRTSTAGMGLGRSRRGYWRVTGLQQWEDVAALVWESSGGGCEVFSAGLAAPAVWALGVGSCVGVAWGSSISSIGWQQELAHISTNIYQGRVHRRIRHHSQHAPEDCKNSRLTEEESIHPLVAISGVLTYNDNMMIMFLVVTSTFAMAMVPFARTATTMTMMYPMMTVMSSMVTTTAATMPVITRTMLMNMMSPAMTVVLVNKISPAVTVIPSTVTSYTSVMSTGAVVSQVMNTMTEWMMVMSTGAVVSQVVNTVTEWMMMFAAPRHLCC
ncbi:hypothetical protein TEA_020152 [Camellia sinensis var. sinensis]|uniref:Uncharacterized protein n=1 Tax=Camellia sinensis var. sinensis TaxID=542762 RepID=A0A4S4DH61_CAMSN|nr:hypothetical protein TEA_020152 [Camellia sinensis var. sinensis]